MSQPADERPPLTRDLTGDELRRWYWLKDELVGLARTLGVRTSGGKELLTERVAAALDGEPFTEVAPARTTGTTQLSGPLTAATVIPRGQRCSQVVRAWFAGQVDGAFRFDGEMRAFFAQTDGTQTLQDALDHYRSTREQGAKAIGEQFEYNRFTRAWHEAHPAGTRDELAEAWTRYRSTPVDRRGRA